MEPANSGQDLYFPCGSCGVSLVVDRAAAGMMLSCQHCGKPITVPAAKAALPVPPARELELRRHLKENESQRTEITGYINQLNIQLHRWQLRQQTLDTRNAELKTELAGLAATAASPIAS